MIVRYIVPELAPMRFLWVLALFTLLFSFLFPSPPLAVLPPCVCTYVCLCLCAFRDLESGLSKKKVLDLKDGARSLRRATSGENLVEAPSDTHAQIVCYTWVLGRKTNRTIRIAGFEELSL